VVEEWLDEDEEATEEEKEEQTEEETEDATDEKEPDTVRELISSHSVCLRM
jgi:hypothetical protein